MDDLEENLPYCPPERAAWLLSNDNNAPLLETDRSDVYALGVLAWRWLVEPLLGAEAPQIDGQVGLNLQAVQEIHRRLRLGLRQPQILPDLADLLGEMLEDDPRSRPAIADVLQRLCTNYGRIAASLAPRESGIYHAAYMPAESKSTIQNWGWITQDPETETGREELRVFLAEELRSAELLYAPEGFFPYQPTPAPREADALRAARYVLVGRQAYWFCTLYTETAPAFRVLREEVEQVLLIKYVREHGRAWRLGNSPLRRRIPGELKLLPVWRNRSPDLSGPRRDGASWKPLLQSIEFKVATPAWLAQRERALEFLVQLRQVEVDAHCYPYV
ncbi:MAG TPA: hypothetical protein PKY30_26180, partial [Myxococcota bacterium]|nr:hypothetical protein [Myxococcota bacterium]